ncbi:MAG: energy transducer TonB [Magnetococcus sp. WYHC-3]
MATLPPPPRSDQAQRVRFSGALLLSLVLHGALLWVGLSALRPSAAPALLPIEYVRLPLPEQRPQRPEALAQVNQTAPQEKRPRPLPPRLGGEAAADWPSLPETHAGAHLLVTDSDPMVLYLAAGNAPQSRPRLHLSLTLDGHVVIRPQVPMNTLSLPQAAYLERIRVLLEGNWRPPYLPVNFLRDHPPRVAFVVGKEGQLISVTLERSSGDEELDNSTLAAVRRVAPFPALPPDWGMTQLRVQTAFEFVPQIP